MKNESRNLWYKFIRKRREDSKTPPITINLSQSFTAENENRKAREETTFGNVVGSSEGIVPFAWSKEDLSVALPKKC